MANGGSLKVSRSTALLPSFAEADRNKSKDTYYEIMAEFLRYRKQLEALQVTVDGLNTEGIAGDVSTLEALVTTLQATVSTLSTTVDTLSVTVNANYATLVTADADLASTIALLNSSLTTLADQVNALSIAFNNQPTENNYLTALDKAVTNTINNERYV